jgi:hypothetical protein
VPFALQEQLINYKIVRAVCQGFAEGSYGTMRPAA